MAKKIICESCGTIFEYKIAKDFEVCPVCKASFDDDVEESIELDEDADELEEAVKNARKNREWRHEYMTLLMRDRENREIGREEGIEIGIIKMVSSLRYFNIPDHDILLKIQEEYNLSQEEAKHYMEM